MFGWESPHGVLLEGVASSLAGNLGLNMVTRKGELGIVSEKVIETVEEFYSLVVYLVFWQA